jgi:hypothetical protein
MWCWSFETYPTEYTHTQTNIPIHIVWMELNLSDLRNNAIHVLGFSEKDGGIVE